MAKGTGVFMPAYAAVRADAAQKGCCSNDDTAQGKRSSTPSQRRRRRAVGAQQRCCLPANAAAMPGSGLMVSGTVNGISLSGPCPLQLQPLTPLSLQQWPSPPPSTCDSDLDNLSTASHASFTSTCSSLLAPSPCAPYAADAAPYSCDIASSHLAQQDMPWSGALLGQQVLLLPQATCQSVLRSDLADLVLLQQQELEVDAAINNLVNLKQQLAVLRQQPSAAVPCVQQQVLPLPSPPLPVSAAPAAMVEGADWAGSLGGEVSVQAMLDAVVAEVQLQQVALQEQQHQERLQAELLQLLFLA